MGMRLGGRLRLTSGSGRGGGGAPVPAVYSDLQNGQHISEVFVCFSFWFPWTKTTSQIPTAIRLGMTKV